MGLGQIKTKCFIKYLETLGCHKARNSKGSHCQYKCPNSIRNIVIREHEKEVPELHVRTNLMSLGKTINDFYDWVKENC